MASDIRNAPEGSLSDMKKDLDEEYERWVEKKKTLSASGASGTASSQRHEDTQRKHSRRSRDKRQAQIGELLASFAQELSNLEAHGDEDPEAVRAELALLDEDLTLEPTTSPAAPTSHSQASAAAAVAEMVAMVDEALSPVGSLIAAEASRECEEVPMRADSFHGAMSAILGGDDARPGGRSPTTRAAWGAGSPGGTNNAASRLATMMDMMEGDEESENILASGAIQSMVQDYSVLKRNLHDYESALTAALAELERLRNEVADMPCATSEVVQLEALLASESETQKELHEENAELAASNEVLRLIIQGALEAGGDIESKAFAQALVYERAMLLKMLQLSSSMSKMASSDLQMPPLPASPSQCRRPSLGGRSRTSSGSTHSRASPLGGGGGSGSPLNTQMDAVPSAFLSDSPPQQQGPASASRTGAGSPAGQAPPMEALASKALAILQGSNASVSSGSGSPRSGGPFELDAKVDANSFKENLRRAKAGDCQGEGGRSPPTATAAAADVDGLDSLENCGAAPRPGRAPLSATAAAAAFGSTGSGGLEMVVDEDEMSEVSSVVFFLGSPTSDREMSATGFGEDAVAADARGDSMEGRAAHLQDSDGA